MNKMYISHPASAQIPKLRKLWQNTFGDSDAFLDIFFETAFSPKRSFCATINDTVIGALYWFDCECAEQKIAYLYAVATAKEFRGQGICHKLMVHTHQHLKEQGYAGAILSPAEESLFVFYGKMGYETCAYASELHYTNTIASLQRTQKTPILQADSYKNTSTYKNLNFHSEITGCENITSHKTLANCKNSTCFENTSILIQQITKADFAKLRRTFLPSDAIIQETENLDFLEKDAVFYTGEDFLLTAQIIENYDHNTPNGLLKKHLR